MFNNATHSHKSCFSIINNKHSDIIIMSDMLIMDEGKKILITVTSYDDKKILSTVTSYSDKKILSTVIS